MDAAMRCQIKASEVKRELVAGQSAELLKELQVILLRLKNLERPPLKTHRRGSAGG